METSNESDARFGFESHSVGIESNDGPGVARPSVTSEELADVDEIIRQQRTTKAINKAFSESQSLSKAAAAVRFRQPTTREEANAYSRDAQIRRGWGKAMEDVFAGTLQLGKAMRRRRNGPL